MFENITLPSNKKFGFFFTFVFFILSLYFFFHNSYKSSFVLVFFATAFFLITILNPNKLLLLNKIWMGFGLVLGMIISPIILGIIYFLLFSPISIITKTIGRDELQLRFEKRETYWNKRENSEENKLNLKNQF